MCIEIHHASSQHGCNCLQSLTLAALLKDAVEHLVHADRRHNQFGRGFDRRRKEVGVRTVSKVLKPAG